MDSAKTAGCRKTLGLNDVQLEAQEANLFRPQGQDNLPIGSATNEL